jgi:catecholate siderophore receptor
VIGKTSEFESLSGGVYAQDLIQVAPHWKLLAGLRYDGMSAQYDAFNRQRRHQLPAAIYKMSKRFGVLFQPSDRHSFHLSYGTSFNTSGDTYSYSAAGEHPAREEHERRARRQDRLRRPPHEQPLRPVPRGQAQRAQHRPAAQHRGAVRQAPRHRLRDRRDRQDHPALGVYGSYTWIWDAEIDKGAEGAEEGRRPSLIPKHQGTLWSTYQVTEKLRVGAGANARTKMTPNRNPGLYSDGYVTYDAMAEYEAIQDKLTLKANLINLTNKFYADSLYANGHYVPGFGRTVYITGSLKF